MTLSFLPEPKVLRIKQGNYKLCNPAMIALSERCLYRTACLLKRSLRQCRINLVVDNLSEEVLLCVDRKRSVGGYELLVDQNGVTVNGKDEAAVFYGVQTLIQLIDQCPNGNLPFLEIEDAPDFENRGIYYDVCRGRVPTLESLMNMIDQLAHFKINHFQLYIEHTFQFRSHPAIGAKASPLTAEDILKLDQYCTDRYIEMVPSLATFGHMGNILQLKAYRHMAEDLGIGKYAEPDYKAASSWKGWTLSPANEESYYFLDSLFKEFLPLFRSRQFNICCDETWDLGKGQSYEICKKRGVGAVYLKHIKTVRKLAAKYGKKVLLWGDIIRKHPELIPKIPRDVTVLDWGYDYNHEFEAIKDFKMAGLPFYACPGTSSWCSMFSRIHEATANISGFAEAAKKQKAAGLLTTDWGDGGHYNFMEYSWHGYLFGAEQAWNINASLKSFTRRFCEQFMGIKDYEFHAALDSFGHISHLKQCGYYQSIWMHVFYATPDSHVFDKAKRTAFVSAKKGLKVAKVSLDCTFAKSVMEELTSIRKTFQKFDKKAYDPQGLLPYWLFAVDCHLHAARKLTAFAFDAKSNAVTVRALKKELSGLRAQFQKLWMLRNRKAEIEITLKKYDTVIKALNHY